MQSIPSILRWIDSIDYSSDSINRINPSDCARSGRLIDRPFNIQCNMIWYNYILLLDGACEKKRWVSSKIACTHLFYISKHWTPPCSSFAILGSSQPSWFRQDSVWSLDFSFRGLTKPRAVTKTCFSQYVLILGGVRRQQTHAARNPSPPTPFPTLMTPNRSTTLSSVIAVTRRCGVEIVALLSSHGRRRAPLSAVETRTLRPTSYVHIDPVWMAGPPVQCCKKVPACARWEWCGPGGNGSNYHHGWFRWGP
jgi:hypothetical protein